jgi:hypothetical protein
MAQLAPPRPPLQANKMKKGQKRNFYRFSR